MLLDIVLVVVGLTLLVGGGEALVRGASGIALLARISPAVVGLTVVAAGTSMPELVVSVQAALANRPGMAVGNVVGSNIFNIAAILGLAALIQPLKVEGNTVRMEWPVMMLATMQIYLLARDGSIDRLEGAFLATAMVVFTAYAVWVARRTTTAQEQADLGQLAEQRAGARAWAVHVATVLMGVGLLAGGSTALVEGAAGLAADLGVSDTVIGLTIVAAGTSTPELVTSLVAAWRGKDDIAVANVIGSNIFNILGILGITALILPLEVPAEILSRDSLWMLAVSALLFPLMWTGMRVSRAEGGVLAAGFLAYVGLLIAGAT